MSARKDKIINRVIEKILKRSEAGYKKYGVGLDKDEQTLDTWLNHLQEELMDAVNYIEKARSCLLYTSPSPRDLSTSRMPSSA